ncbi:putative cysteine alpha-hairpin motif superfamily [Lupinus albus]|uniref:Putative cysteine alpha-hairpin motif superfamily n=1 Tax=Lupinus albus TaxID=3870 RepID=A0A6A4Q1M6_LUPAL|nr:putative cysteine alpha-hairpin motif superfamily [Lupinus albus]
MGKEGEPKAVVCAQEALNLLNCVTQSPYDQDKCLHLLHSLRDCVLAKKVKKFSLAGQEHQDTKPSTQKA